MIYVAVFFHIFRNISHSLRSGGANLEIFFLLFYSCWMAWSVCIMRPNKATILEFGSMSVDKKRDICFFFVNIIWQLIFYAAPWS